MVAQIGRHASESGSSGSSSGVAVDMPDSAVEHEVQLPTWEGCSSTSSQASKASQRDFARATSTVVMMNSYLWNTIISKAHATTPLLAYVDCLLQTILDVLATSVKG
eukprot:2616860-Amphidinium_carterae.1